MNVDHHIILLFSWLKDMAPKRKRSQVEQRGARGIRKRRVEPWKLREKTRVFSSKEQLS